MESKKPWQSKTNWVALIVALSAFVPSVGEMIAKNPEAFSMAVGAVFGFLRVITKEKISIK
jgi:hypothetical protein